MRIPFVIINGGSVLAYRVSPYNTFVSERSLTMVSKLKLYLFDKVFEKPKVVTNCYHLSNDGRNRT